MLLRHQSLEPIESRSQVLEVLFAFIAMASLLSGGFLSRSLLLGGAIVVAVNVLVGSPDQVCVVDASGIDRQLIVILASELARAGVLELDVCILKETQVLESPVVDTADFFGALFKTLAVFHVYISLGVLGRASSGGVFLALLAAGAQALVIVGLAIISTDRKVELGALLALSADRFGLSGGVVGGSSVSAEFAAVAVEPALVVVVGVVLTEDIEKDAGTVVAGRDNVGALAVADKGSSDALEEAVVVIGLAVSAAYRVVFPGAVALRRARLYGQSDLVVAKEHTVALVSGADHCANGLEFKGAVAHRGDRKWLAGDGDVWVNPSSGGGSARAEIGLCDLAGVHSAFVSIGDSVNSTDFNEYLLTIGF